MGIKDLRIQYETRGLDRADLADDPVAQLNTWYAEAESAGVVEPNAMVLGTIDVHGHPDARVVLARGIDATGITFYTNRESDKGAQLAANPRASVVFAWLELHRQVRVRGRVSLVDDATSDEYFASRPRESRIGAWASDQSRVLSDRSELEARVADTTARWEGTEVPRPPHWGGYLISFETIEFWQGRPSRLHDRFRYSRSADGWRIDRLSP